MRILKKGEFMKKNLIRFIFCFSFLQVPACSLLKKPAYKKEKTTQPAQNRVPQTKLNLMGRGMRIASRIEGGRNEVIKEMEEALTLPRYGFRKVIAMGTDFRRTKMFPLEFVAKKAREYKSSMRSPSTAHYSTDDLEEGLKELYGSNFIGANLSGVHWAFIGRSSNFSKSSLQGTFLVGRFEGSFFHHAQGRKASLTGVFIDAEFTGARMRGAVFAGDFSTANFKRAYLQGAKLEGRFKGVVFERTDLRNASVGKECGLPVARFAKFIRADMRNMDLGEWDVEGAQFIGTKLQGADLSRVKNIKKAHFEDIQYDMHTTKWPKGFTPKFFSL